MAARKRKSIRKNVIGSFTHETNAGGLSDGGLIVTPADVGAETIELGFADGGAVDLLGTEASFLVPTEARAMDGEPLPGMLFASATSTGVDAFQNTGGEGLLIEQPWRVFPNESWTEEYDDETGDGWSPSTAWIPGSTWDPAESKSVSTFIPTDEATFASRLGVETRELRDRFGPYRTVEADEELRTDELLIAAFTDDRTFPSTPLTSPDRIDIGQLFNAGISAPLSGATFGFSVLATPNASVAGQNLNPLAGLEFEEIFAHEEVRDVLRRAGVTDARTVEWLVGPDAVDGDRVPPLVANPDPILEADPATTLLDDEVDLRTFVGVLNGQVGPWAIAIHAARLVDDDIVLATGINRRPVADTDATGVLDGETLTRARERTTATMVTLRKAGGDR
ncbi:hypothetical protein [Natrialba sp. INN-245]|uniref:hypothetical protein n=1 Tax=Natrialba sp. INN-245 TaxID=2690967 RepID=UPI00131243BF|nr:hypothetical protein [Natrialba sp. INN-245]MWV39099.1 hypothetical protein [Natrialba sp. INN-245]